MSHDSATPIDILFVYSPSEKDARYKSRLQRDLSPMVNKGWIRLWDRSNLPPDRSTTRAFESVLARASIVVLLVSPAFLSDELVQRKQLPLVWQFRQRVGSFVIPVIARPCAWKEHEEIADLAPLLASGDAISCSNNEDEAFLEVGNGLRRLIRDKRAALRPAPPEEMYTLRAALLFEEARAAHTASDISAWENVAILADRVLSADPFEEDAQNASRRAQMLLAQLRAGRAA